LRKPISGFVGCCCARTAGGHTTAVLLRNVMNSRRLMASPARELLLSIKRISHYGIEDCVVRYARAGRPHVRFVPKADISSVWRARTPGRCTPASADEFPSVQTRQQPRVLPLYRRLAEREG